MLTRSFYKTFFFWLAAVPLFAQNVLPRRLHFKTWTTKEGLPSNLINDLDRDRFGFLWLATDVGAVRFDGVRFKKYAIDGNARLLKVFADSLLTVFAVNLEGDFFRLDRRADRFEKIGTTSTGQLKGRKTSWRPFALDRKNGRVLFAEPKGVFAVSLENGQRSTVFEAAITGAEAVLIEPTAGAIWVAAGNGVHRFDPKTGRSEVFLPEKAFSGGVLGDGGAWFLESLGSLFRFDLASQKMERVGSAQPPPAQPAAFEGQDIFPKLIDDRQIWATTLGGGFLALDPKTARETVRFWTENAGRDALSSDDIRCLKKFGGDFWLGTGKGLTKFNPSEQAVFYEKIDSIQKACGCRPQAILRDPVRENHFWLGLNSGLILYDAAQKKVVRWLDFGKNGWEIVNRMAFSADQNLWMATKAGLLRVDPGNFETKKWPVEWPDKKGSPAALFGLVIDEKERIWLDCRSDLGFFDPKTERFERIDFELDTAARSITSISKGQNQNIWAATWAGVFEISTTEKRVLRRLGDRPTQAVLEDGPFLWVSDEKGLARIEKSTGAERIFGKKEGLENPHVKSIVRDAHGNFWMNTFDGLFRFNPKTERFSKFTEADGLFDNLIGGVLGIDGTTVFAGATNGYQYFEPLADAPAPPQKPVFTAFRALDSLRAFDPDDPRLSIDWAENVFEFEFASPDFYRPEGLRYETQLVGFDPQPIQKGAANAIRYTNLDPGDYLFRVWAINAEGLRSAEPSAFRLRIRPPFWATWWFRGLAVAAVLGLGWAIFKSCERQRLEKERIRLRIARDLHDEVGSTLTTISILSESALRSLEADIEKTRLEGIGERARAALSSMSDIVWAVNPQNDSMEKTAERMARFAAETLESAGVAPHFDFDPAALALGLPMEKRKDFYLFFKEATTNAAKHSRAANAFFSLKKDGEKLVFELRDDGGGFSEKAEKSLGGNGLRNLRARAEALGATEFLAENRSGGTGARVRLVLPIGK